MPFAILVSALGAIVAATIAMFGFHSWAAFKVAPIIGASLGLLLAIFSLRLSELPLSSTLETYRSAVGVRGKPNLSVALSVGVIVSLVELPGILLGSDFTHTMCVTGWLFVLVGTVYLGFRFTTYPVKLDIFQMVGGTACLAIFGSFMYTFVVAIPSEMKSVSSFDLAKMLFIFNACAALVSAVSCYFLLAVASGFRAIKQT